MKKSEKAPYKCNQCKVTSKTLADLRKHTKTKHNKLEETIIKVHETIDHTRKSIKRLPIFTPIIKPFKRSKPDQQIVKLDVLNEETMKSKKVLDENLSILSISLNESNMQVNLDESTSITNTCNEASEDPAERIDHKLKAIDKSSNFYCTKCGEGFEKEDQLDEHVEQAHVISSDNIQPEAAVTDQDQSLTESVVICGECGNGFQEISQAEVHMRSHVKETIFCILCTQNFVTELELEWHMETDHAGKNFKCLACEFCCGAEEDLGVHIVTKHAFPCYKCENVVFDTQDLLSEHNILYHKSRPQKCDKCGEDLHQNEDMKEHVCRSVMTGPKTYCEQCEFRGDTVNDFITHLLTEHSRNPEVIECQFCDFKTFGSSDFDKHVENDHQELALIKHLISNLKRSEENFETFKVELSNTLNKFIDSLNVIKQELFILRQGKYENDKKVDNIEKALIELKKEGLADSAPKITPHEKQKSTKKHECEKCGKIFIEEEYFNEHMLKHKEANSLSERSQQADEIKACIIGDSVSDNLDHRVIANAMKCKLRTAKAYSTLEDHEENVAKSRTKFPHKNFSNVIESELKKEDTNILIIQAGSIDITNMKTNGDNTKRYIEYFKQQSHLSASNLFTKVSNAFVANPSLQKAIIMKLTPRYDTSENDPQSIKSALVQIYNDTLLKLWIESPNKDKIHIGSHSLECAGGVRKARYMLGRKYDGLHMYGPSGRKAYTESVLNILRDAGFIRNNPPRYFHAYHDKQTHKTQDDKYICPTQETDYLRDRDVRHTNISHQYAVPTSNRFYAFNQKNW